MHPIGICWPHACRRLLAPGRDESQPDWWADLDMDIEATFRDRPVVIAESVKSQGGTELVGSPSGT